MDSHSNLVAYNRLKVHNVCALYVIKDCLFCDFLITVPQSDGVIFYKLGWCADALLLLPNAPESDRYGVMSTTSFAATMAIFDALMVALMEEKDYQLSEFALIHPGGAVGKQIN